MTDPIDPTRARAASRNAMQHPAVRAALARVPIAQRAAVARQIQAQIGAQVRGAIPTQRVSATEDRE